MCVRPCVRPCVGPSVRASMRAFVRPCAVVSISGSDKYRPSRCSFHLLGTQGKVAKAKKIMK